MQTRREFLATTAAFAALGAAPAAHADDRPNVVIILSDDQGYGDLGCLGNPVLKTPHLDVLHAESVRLTRYYVCPVCAPTRASLMTGRYSYRTGVVDTFVGRAMMDPREATVAEMFRAAGYGTGIFGKWHLGDSYPLRPVDRGFEDSLVLKGGGLVQPSDPRLKSYFDPILWRNGVETPTQGYCTDVITDAAIDFVRARKGQPFFTVLATNAPHTPLDVAKKYVAPYHGQVPEDDAKFYGMISNLDENVGRFLGELDALGLRENTIVIFFTDNGTQFAKTPRFNAGLRGQKGTVYEGGVRVPCFVRWPKYLKGGTDCDGLASVIDLAPTLLAACGVAAKEGVAFDGVNLLPVLQGTAPSPKRAIFTQWHRGDAPEAYRNAAVIMQQFKLVDGKELYDLHADRAEEKDLAAAQADVAADLRAQYDAWFKDVCATRGFAPVPITIGDPHESPTWLTAQDMREVSGWGAGDVGAWELAAAQPGDYMFELNWLPENRPGESVCNFTLGSLSRTTSMAANAAALQLGPFPLAEGRTRLQTWMDTTAGKRRPDWVLARKI